jgi:hypothetical protein
LHPRATNSAVSSADCIALLSSVGTKIVFIEIVASYGFSPQADHHILSRRVKAGRGDQIADITRNCCDLAIDPHLSGHVLPNFRKQLARAVRLRHIVITSRRPRCLFFSIQRVGSDGDDRIASQHLRPSKDQNAPVIGQGCADPPSSPADWKHQITPYSWWTSSPLHPGLGLRYTQPAPLGKPGTTRR